MTTREKILNLLLKPFGLAVITAEDYEKGRRDSEMVDRLQNLVNPLCAHGTRTNWCEVCEAERNREEE